MSRQDEQDPAPARAAYLDKEKPAVRVLLTAGVAEKVGFEPTGPVKGLLDFELFGVFGSTQPLPDDSGR